MNIQDDIVARFIDRCYESGIKDPIRFLLDKMPRVYGYLKGAFPRGILPTDIDGEVEINGQFLRLEFKHHEALRGGRVPKGQIRCFESLLDTGRFTVFLIGHDQAGAAELVHVWGSRGRKVFDPCDNSKLYQLCSQWAHMAESQKQNK